MPSCSSTRRSARASGCRCSRRWSGRAGAQLALDVAARGRRRRGRVRRCDQRRRARPRARAACSTTPRGARALVAAGHAQFARFSWRRARARRSRATSARSRRRRYGGEHQIGAPERPGCTPSACARVARTSSRPARRDLRRHGRATAPPSAVRERSSRTSTLIENAATSASPAATPSGSARASSEAPTGCCPDNDATLAPGDRRSLDAVLGDTAAGGHPRRRGAVRRSARPDLVRRAALQRALGYSDDRAATASPTGPATAQRSRRPRRRRVHGRLAALPRPSACSTRTCSRTSRTSTSLRAREAGFEVLLVPSRSLAPRRRLERRRGVEHRRLLRRRQIDVARAARAASRWAREPDLGRSVRASRLDEHSTRRLRADDAERRRRSTACRPIRLKCSRMVDASANASCKRHDRGRRARRGSAIRASRVAAWIHRSTVRGRRDDPRRPLDRGSRAAGASRSLQQRAQRPAADRAAIGASGRKPRRGDARDGGRDARPATARARVSSRASRSAATAVPPGTGCQHCSRVMATRTLSASPGVITVRRAKRRRAHSRSSRVSRRAASSAIADAERPDRRDRGERARVDDGGRDDEAQHARRRAASRRPRSRPAARTCVQRPRPGVGQDEVRQHDAVRDHRGDQRRERDARQAERADERDAQRQVEDGLADRRGATRQWRPVPIAQITPKRSGAVKISAAASIASGADGTAEAVADPGVQERRARARSAARAGGTRSTTLIRMPRASRLRACVLAGRHLQAREDRHEDVDELREHRARALGAAHRGCVDAGGVRAPAPRRSPARRCRTGSAPRRSSRPTRAAEAGERGHAAPLDMAGARAEPGNAHGAVDGLREHDDELGRRRPP